MEPRTSPGAFPLGFADLQFGMGDQQVPNDGLKSLRMRRDVFGIDRWHNDTRRGGLRGLFAGGGARAGCG